ncbi:MAG: glycosyl hydrolase family 2, partial [Prevotellaceae bacterium]|nr:glycosyl hydrolase family 2 [Prevotellaceae bacterium]
MKKKEVLKLASLVWSLAACTTLQAQEWPAGTTEARPATRWWWLGSAVDKENLTYNMEAYARAGMGGVEITPIYGVQGNDSANIPFLSPQWMDILQYTEAEGTRLGVEVDMNTGTGWPFGGPETALTDAAAKALFQSYEVQGGKEIALDVQVQEKEQQGVALLGRAMAYGEDGTCLDLTAKVKEDTLQWNAPAGTWRVIVLYVGRTLQQVKRAAPGGEGYVMDHLDSGAVQRYLSRFDKAFQASGTPFPHTFFNDSYEVYGADWTPCLLEEFAKRRGYKLEEHFPEFLDRTRPEATARVVSDYRETLSDLLIEHFTDQWTAWAHGHGAITRNQAHGSPSNLIDTYAAVDIPECEGFGLSDLGITGLRKDRYTRKNDADLTMLKYASSAAHITGKPYTSSETFTWLTEHFRTSLSQCKPDMDLMFAQGVNHAFFHGTPYSPKEASWPGWKFYASIDMSPTNSIWRDAPAFFQYITRCQSFLQAGKPDNDYLLYLPLYDIWQRQPGRLVLFGIHEMPHIAPKFIQTVNAIRQCGYDMDYISDKYLQATSVKAGKLVTPGGTTYKAVIVPAVQL